MKTLKNLILIIIFVLMTTHSAIAEIDTLAKVILFNPIKTNSQTLELSIYLRCLSNRWDGFANATFQRSFLHQSHQKTRQVN